MHCYLMQDFITVRGQSTSLSATQSESSWLDLSMFQDVVAWLDVKEVTGTVTMAYQTGPTKDDILFQSVTAAFNVAAGLAVTVMLKDTTTTPLSRWLRWQLACTGGTTPWDVTFRVLVAANAPGPQARIQSPGAPTLRAAGPSGSSSTPMHLMPGSTGTNVNWNPATAVNSTGYTKATQATGVNPAYYFNPSAGTARTFSSTGAGLPKRGRPGGG